MGQQTIVQQQGDRMYDDASMAMDTSGTLWAAWMAGRSDQFEITHRVGNVWAPAQIIFPNDFEQNFKMRFAIAADDSFWVVWHRVVNGTREIYSCSGNGISWTPAQLVNTPNAEYDFSPMIGAGGGNVWVTWYRNNGNFSQSHVYVSHWTGETWAPEEDLTAGLPGYHWFSNVAVGSDGTAHVVWGDSDNGYIYYVHSLEQGGWSEPKIINPVPFQVAGASWPAPVICLDPAGTIHVAWVGQRVVSGTFEDWDIYYSHSDGSMWSAPLQVNPDDQLTDAYPDIRASAPNDVWITWYHGNPASATLDTQAMVVHWNGTRALGVYRIDNGEYPDNGLIGGLCLDALDNPWAIWSTIGENYGPGAVVYNHWDPTVAVEWTNLQASPANDSVLLTWWASPRSFSFFDIEKLSSGEFVFQSRVSDNGGSEYSWKDSPLSLGSWTYRLRGVRSDGSVAILGPVTADVGTTPKLLSLQLMSQDTRGGAVRLRMGLPISSSVSLDLVDVLGRRVAHQELESMPAGWHLVDMALPRPSPAAGIYWFQARTGTGHVAVSFLRQR
jgi:hypothetical protein